MLESRVSMFWPQCDIFTFKWPDSYPTSFPGSCPQGVITYISRVEAFAAEIKIESCKWSKPFVRADQGIEITSKLRKSKAQEHAAPIWPLTHKKIKRSRALEGKIKWSSTLFADQKYWSRLHTLNRQHIIYYPSCPAFYHFHSGKRVVHYFMYVMSGLKERV